MVGAPLTPPTAGPIGGSTGERYAPGTSVVLRELIDHRVRSARPLLVVEDGDAGLAAYLVPRSEVAWPRLVDGEQSQTPDQGWLLRREEWQGPGCLFLFPPGEAYAAVLFFDRDDQRPLSWKVDFLRPPTRHGSCLDTLDWALDLLVPLDRRDWTVKDTDDLAQLRLLELLGPGGDRRVEAARARAERAIAAGEAPFDDRWLHWRPPADVAPLRLPAEIFAGDDPAGAPAGAGEVPGVAPLRSGSGTTVLDADGRSWFDIDLGGGRLVHGHAHPAVVGAVTRQLGLGLGAEAEHLPGQALGRTLTRRLGCDALRWTPSGGAALAVAVTLTRRHTGRVAVARWRSGPEGRADGRAGGDAGFVDLDEDDPTATLARLRVLGDELAAILVDPLALAASAGGPPAVEQERTALLDLLRAWSSAGPVVVVADERRGIGAGPAGGCRRLGLTPPLTVVGEGWFGGYGGGALLGRDDLLAGFDRPAAGWSEDLTGPGPGTPPHPVVAVAGLATLDLLGGAALTDLGARAQRLRDRLGLAGVGWAFRLPPGAGPTLGRAGVHAPGRWGFLATVGRDDEVERLTAALASALDHAWGTRARCRHDREHPRRHPLHRYRRPRGSRRGRRTPRRASGRAGARPGRRAELNMAAGADRVEGSARPVGAVRLRLPRLRSRAASAADVLTLVALVTILVVAFAGNRRSEARPARSRPGAAAAPASTHAHRGSRVRGRRWTRVTVGALVMAAMAALGLAGAAVTRADGRGTVLATPAAVHGRTPAPGTTDRDPVGAGPGTPTATVSDPSDGTPAGEGADPPGGTAAEGGATRARGATPATNRAAAPSTSRATAATTAAPPASVTSTPASTGELAAPSRAPSTASPSRVVPLPPATGTSAPSAATTVPRTAAEPAAPAAATSEGPVALAPPAAAGAAVDPSAGTTSAQPASVAPGDAPELDPARLATVLARISYPWQQRLPGWTLAFLPGRPGLRGLTYVQLHRIEIYVRPEFTDQQVAEVIAHELGHAVDVTFLDGAERAQWLAARGLPTSTPWFSVDEGGDFGSGTGDFAEAFATWQVGKVSQSRLAGPVTETQLLVLATLAGG